MVTYDPKDKSTYTTDPLFAASPPVVVGRDPVTGERRYALGPDETVVPGKLNNIQFATSKKDGALGISASFFVGRVATEGLNLASASAKVTEVASRPPGPDETPVPGAETEILVELTIPKKAVKAEAKAKSKKNAKAKPVKKAK